MRWLLGAKGLVGKNRRGNQSAVRGQNANSLSHPLRLVQIQTPKQPPPGAFFLSSKRELKNVVCSLVSKSAEGARDASSHPTSPPSLWPSD